jgi:hypothetical protein
VVRGLDATETVKGSVAGRSAIGFSSGTLCRRR